MKELTITVSGLAGHGKTLVARRLAAYLRHNVGFDVVLIDEDQLVATPDTNEMPREFNAKVTIIAKEVA